MRKVTLLAAALLLLLATQPSQAVPGDTVLSLPSPHSCPQGLTFDGSCLWTVDRLSDMMYKIDPKNGLLSSRAMTCYSPTRGF